MTYEQYKELPKMVRVIDSTRGDGKGKKVMIGDVCEVKVEYYYDKTTVVYTKDKSDSYVFNNSDIQELTPLIYEGYQIAIGDDVKWQDDWYKVQEYIYHDEEVKLNVISCGDNYIFALKDIEDIKPLYTQKPSLSDEALISEMKKRGLLKDGVVLR